MNEYDSNRIYDLTSVIDFKKTDIKKEADCFVLNTCHIRKKATEKVYDEIGRVKKDFKNLTKPLVVVSGCVAQAESEEMIKREPYIDMVIGPQSYHKIGDLLKKFLPNDQKEETEFDTITKIEYFDKIKNESNKISAFLTIQEGCDKFCSFCVVPYTRGSEFSRSVNEIKEEIKKYIDNGIKEVILLGQNVNAYHDDSQSGKHADLAYLINKISEFDDIERIRYMTSHPNDMTNSLIEAHGKNFKLMPFLHLPIQSGSDKILQKMNRKHNVKKYYKIIDNFS